MSELQFLNESQSQILSHVEAVIAAVEAAQKDANRTLLASEKTTGPIAHALRTIEAARYSFSDICDMARNMADTMGKIKDECQAYTLGVEAGVKMILDMLTAERQAILMRGSPQHGGGGGVAEARLLGRWIELFHRRVMDEHGITNKKGE
jgi:hypothetical protein